jgi:hypothetical protein
VTGIIPRETLKITSFMRVVLDVPCSVLYRELRRMTTQFSAHLDAFFSERLPMAA